MPINSNYASFDFKAREKSLSAELTLNKIELLEKKLINYEYTESLK